MSQSASRPERLLIPAQIALAALLAYMIGFGFTSLFPGYLAKIGALWSAISAVVVMVTASLSPALNPGLNALLRFAESCIGTAVAVLVVLLWPQRRELRGNALR